MKNSHPYLRAYMAGIVVPTAFLLVIAAAFTAARFYFGMPLAVERAIVFPLAVVPNLWGAWNMLHARLGGRFPIGLHGALLPLILVPAGFWLGRALNLPFISPAGALAGLPLAVLVYYLVWKHVVARLNGILGIS